MRFQGQGFTCPRHLPLVPYLGLFNYDQTSIRSGYRTTDHQQVVIDINLCHGKALDGDPIIAHVAGRTRTFDNTRRVSGLTDRTRTPDVHRTVRLRTAAEVVTLDG